MYKNADSSAPKFSPFGVQDPQAEPPAQEPSVVQASGESGANGTASPNASTGLAALQPPPGTLNPQGISTSPNYDLSASKQDRINSLFAPMTPAAIEPVASTMTSTPTTEPVTNTTGLAGLKNSRKMDDLNGSGIGRYGFVS